MLVLFCFVLLLLLVCRDLATSYANVYMTVNDAPKNGDCTLSSTTGIALKTPILVSCDDWEDDDKPLSYAFNLYDGLTTISIQRASPNSTSNFTLAYGNFTLTAIISDYLGAKTTQTFEIETFLESADPDEALSSTLDFLDSFFQDAVTNFDTELLSLSTNGAVTMLDYLNEFSTKDSDLNIILVQLRENLLSSISGVFDGVETDEFGLTQETQLISCVVRTPDQVSTDAGVNNLERMAYILDNVDTLNSSENTIFTSKLNGDIAS